MKRRLLFSALVTINGLLLSVLSMSSASAASTSHKVCSESPRVGYARCFSSVLSDPTGLIPLATSTPKGYGPASFKAAYGDRGSANTAVGVVVAYDAPTMLADLTRYSQTYGLPVITTCKSASQVNCLEKFNQHGSASLPGTSSSWAVEASLDVETVHGMCPGCRIDVVEANSSSMADLAQAANQAAMLGAKVISNSYGGPESSGEARYDSDYSHSGVATVASSGDSGYGTNYPAASAAVVAVGGTSLKMNNNRLLSETVWQGAGSGCSQFEFKPSWQKDKRCSMRSVADIAADADPATGAAIYDSFPNSGHSGWYTVGGTSLAAPLVAGMIANSGLVANQPAYLYEEDSSIVRDIVTGSNGSCSLSYLCKASTGYDGPTGLGVLSNL